jgi:hypothetical protein
MGGSQPKLPGTQPMPLPKPPSRPELDQTEPQLLLLQYLREDREERAVMRGELTKITTVLDHIVDRLEKLEKAEEDTKITRINELQQQIAEQKRLLEKRIDATDASKSFWTRYGVALVFSGVGFVLATAITTAIGVIFFKR